MTEPLIPQATGYTRFLTPRSRADLDAAFRVLARPGRVRPTSWHQNDIPAPIIGWIREPRVLMHLQGSIRDASNRRLPTFEASRRDAAMIFPVAGDFRALDREIERLPTEVVRPIPLGDVIYVTFLIKPCLLESLMVRWHHELRRALIPFGRMPSPALLDEIFGYLYLASDMHALDSCNILVG